MSNKYSEKEVERILALRDASLKDPKHLRGLLECLSPACDQIAAAPSAQGDKT